MKTKKTKNDLILSVAQKVFAYFGVRKTTIDEIAKKAGIGKGTIYNYFKSKEELFAQVAKREENELKEKILDAIGKTNDPEKQLKTFFVTKIAHIFNLKNFYSIKKEMLDSVYSELEAVINSYYEFEKKTLTRIIKNGIELKIFKVDNLALIVNVIILTSKSLELYWLRNEEYDSPEKPIREMKNLIKVFFNGIRNRNL